PPHPEPMKPKGRRRAWPPTATLHNPLLLQCPDSEKRRILEHPQSLRPFQPAETIAFVVVVDQDVHSERSPRTKRKRCDVILRDREFIHGVPFGVRRYRHLDGRGGTRRFPLGRRP